MSLNHEEHGESRLPACPPARAVARRRPGNCRSRRPGSRRSETARGASTSADGFGEPPNAPRLPNPIRVGLHQKRQPEGDAAKWGSSESRDRGQPTHFDIARGGGRGHWVSSHWSLGVDPRRPWPLGHLPDGGVTHRKQTFGRSFFKLLFNREHVNHTHRMVYGEGDHKPVLGNCMVGFAFQFKRQYMFY